jgi:hypothetical protein
VSGPDPTQRGPEPILGVWLVPVEVLDLTRRSDLYIQGSGTFPWGSGPTVDILEYIVFSGHVVAPEPSTWWGRVLFTTRLEIAAWVPRLHTVVRGTLVLGYRHPLCNKYIYDIYDIYLYALCYYMCCLLWRIYEMHLALSLKTWCDTAAHTNTAYIGHSSGHSAHPATWCSSDHSRLSHSRSTTI